MPGTVAFGPVVFTANTIVVSAAKDIPAATDTTVQATVDCSAMAAGIQREVAIQYRRSNIGTRAATGSNDGNSNVLDSPDAGFVTGDIGKVVWGGNIPDNTTIVTIVSPTEVTVSNLIVLGGVSYPLTIGDRWQTIARVTGITIGGPDLNRQGGVQEWGAAAPLPDVGVAGRQARAAGRFDQTVTASGHLSST